MEEKQLEGDGSVKDCQASSEELFMTDNRLTKFSENLRCPTNS